MIKADDIQAMPLHENLQVMETLWDNIAQQGDDLEMPQW